MSRFVVQVCVIAGVCLSAATAEASKRAHERLQTKNGAVHVWTPASYDRETAGIVIYVHGYYTDVDRAWREHRLASQFARSRLNAVFIACEAPRGPRDEVRWSDVRELLDTVAGTVDLPEGRVVVVGHSGAHRTLTQWLGTDAEAHSTPRGSAELIDTIVLVDAYYGDKPEVREWLAAGDDHRLIQAASDTRRWADELHADLPETLVFERFPRARNGKLRGARGARVVYVRSQHDHMSLVTGGVALPMLLRALQLPRIAR